MKLLIKIGKVIQKIPWKRKAVRISIMLFLSGMVCFLNYHFYYPLLPEIVFVCDKYDLQGEPCEIKFIDQKGMCYHSDDVYVCKSMYGDLINAYKSGKIKDKIQYIGSCSRNGVINRYRQIYRNAKNIRLQLYLGYTNEQSLPRWDWEALYFDESGEIQRVDLHANYPGYEEETNNRKANRIYKWCRDIMGEVEE